MFWVGGSVGGGFCRNFRNWNSNRSSISSAFYYKSVNTQIHLFFKLRDESTEDIELVPIAWWKSVSFVVENLLLAQL